MKISFPDQVLKVANSVQGRPPYKSMGKSLDGFNCEGWVSWVYREAGEPIDHLIPAYSAADETPSRAKAIIEPVLESHFERVAESDWQTGDIVLLLCGGGLHLGILIENRVWTMSQSGLRKLPMVGCRAEILSAHRLRPRRGESTERSEVSDRLH